MNPTASGTPARSAMAGIVRALVLRPDLWWAALGALRRMAAPGWWRTRPYLPVPDQRLWEFRMVTAYGRSDAVPRPVDLISYLEWCRSTEARRLVHGTRWVTRPRAGHLEATGSG